MLNPQVIVDSLLEFGVGANLARQGNWQVADRNGTR
jgi:hypothetical protein